MSNPTLLVPNPPIPTWIFFGKFSFGKCRTVPENVTEGTLFEFQTCILLENNKKIKRDPLASAGFVGYAKKVKHERGDPLETKKLSKKVAQCRKKRKQIERGTL